MKPKRYGIWNNNNFYYVLCFRRACKLKYLPNSTIGMGKKKKAKIQGKRKALKEKKSEIKMDKKRKKKKQEH